MSEQIVLGIVILTSVIIIVGIIISLMYNFYRERYWFSIIVFLISRIRSIEEVL
jgi:hypothetical protein